MASIYNLPREMLKKIFEYYLETEGYTNLIRNIYKVCTSWRDVCKIPLFWVTYNGSLSFEDMMTACEGGCFENTLNFTISSCDSPVSEDQAFKLFSQLENVSFIDLSNLKHITPYIIEKMASKCTNLQKIQFGNISCKLRDRSVSEALDIPLKNFFSRVGSNLLSIDLSYCEVPNFSAVITWITDDCPNLEELHLVHVQNSSYLFPTNIVQKKCPKLKVLKLDYNINPSVERWEHGFPNLEVFAFNDFVDHIMSSEKLVNILFRSSCLKSLNISHCYINLSSLCSLPTNDLQILDMTGCVFSLNHYEPAFIQKWCHSLKIVYFSHTALCGQSINEAVLDLISTPSSSPLEELYLVYAPVKMHVVDKILRKCSALRVLDLEGCDYLDDDMQKCFEGERELERLKGMVSIFTE